jgi:hypothetical protein
MINLLCRLNLHSWKYIKTIEHGVIINGFRNVYEYIGDRVCSRCGKQQWTIYPFEIAEGTWKDR